MSGNSGTTTMYYHENPKKNSYLNTASRNVFDSNRIAIMNRCKNMNTDQSMTKYQ